MVTPTWVRLMEGLEVGHSFACMYSYLALPWGFNKHSLGTQRSQTTDSFSFSFFDFQIFLLLTIGNFDTYSANLTPLHCCIVLHSTKEPQCIQSFLYKWAHKVFEAVINMFEMPLMDWIPAWGLPGSKGMHMFRLNKHDQTTGQELY